MDGRGGARPGAGRPAKAERFANEIARAEKKIADKLPWLVDKLLELAEGVQVQKMVRGEPAIYDQPPSLDAIRYLIDRVMGKPALEVTEQKDDPDQDKPKIIGYTVLVADTGAAEKAEPTKAE